MDTIGFSVHGITTLGLNIVLVLLKALLRTNVLNDVTAALFSVSFSQLPAAKKHTKNGDVIKDVNT